MHFLLVILFLFQSPELRTWRSTVGTTLEAEFVEFDEGNVILKPADGETKSVQFAKLSTSDQRYVMRAAEWGRVWRDSTGKHETIAELISFDSDKVKLERANGQTFKMEIEKLSERDQEFVRSLRSPNKDTLPGRFEAKVVAVKDGDTIVVLLDKKEYEIRLSGIDAPEYGQPFSNQAKKLVGNLVFGKTIRGSTLDFDQYGRSLCLIKLPKKTDGVNRLDHLLLKNGLAWHYTHFSDDKKRTELEAEARKLKVGLWAQAKTIPPWDYRKWKNR